MSPTAAESGRANVAVPTTGGTTVEDDAQIDAGVVPSPDTRSSSGASESGEAQGAAGAAKGGGGGSPSHRQLYERLRTRTGRMPRQWLIDRCDGNSRCGDGRRPPSRACWAPVPLKWFPDMLEQNCLCERVGRFGCVDPAGGRKRRALLWTCLVANIVGFAFLVLASFAIAQESFGILWHFSFTEVWLEIIMGPKDWDTPSIFAVGLRAAAWRQTVLGNNDTVVPFDHFCTIARPPSTPATMARTFMTLFVEKHSESNQGCNSCRDISKKIVPSLFLSMLGYIPNFTTDVLRMYENYDVNCQKFLASIFSWISLSTAIYTWVNYHRNCFAYLDSTPTALNEDLEPIAYDDVDSGGGSGGGGGRGEDAFLVVRFQYRPGFGEVCLALATLLKVVDILCNIMLPTPSITRDHAEQAEYEWRYGRAHDEEGGTNAEGAASTADGRSGGCEPCEEDGFCTDGRI